MADDLVRLHLKDPDLLVVGVQCTLAAREARARHGALPTAAHLLAQGLAAGFGVSGLLGGTSRVNLQLSCDGPLKGLLVDAAADGVGRGYPSNPAVDLLADDGDAAVRGALGGQGTLSVLRELKNGEFYRGSIALEHFDLARDLERYYRDSEQIPTAVRLEVRPDGEESLGRVAAVFVQALPGTEPQALQALRDLLDGPLPGGETARARDLVRAIADRAAGGWEVLAECPLAFRCGCSKERVLRAVSSMGRDEIRDILAREGKAVARCAFCNTSHEIPGPELERLLAAMDEP